MVLVINFLNLPSLQSSKLLPKLFVFPFGLNLKWLLKPCCAVKNG